MNNNNKHRSFFFTAALFNWTVAIIFLFAYQPVFNLIGLSPVPQNPIYLHLFACLVALFGLGYYWVSLDFDKNRNIVYLGIVGKLAVFALPVGYYFAGSISWQLPALTCVDLVFAMLFLNTLRQSSSS
ncbi:hypothetical protein Q4508_17765 [Amphritea sp. 2_MG-2023]|uniref:hypothetical protein n=1 Tax=Amphritea TaxID=515417 RepID=UPI001C06C5D4|nr:MULTISPECIES: hypothetical protein [Amphritea]MBU2964653.1 hypothetical protein [Amphritea atlantica]MDO6420405.1 hypothetical protein [Amphritea sp. 2_MG-2023]